MRTALILLLAIAATSAHADTKTVWKWVDERGVTHYSDQPVPGATQVQLNVGTSSRPRPSAEPSAPSAPSAPQQPAASTAASTERVYRNFEIWKPLREETIANTGGVVQVNVRVDPALNPQHRLSLYLDGKLVEGFPRNTTDFELKEVARGMHSVVAIILDPAGTKVQETSPIVFHVRQESVANPPVGPSLRPPPKPTPRNTANKLPTTQPSYAALNGGSKQIDPSTNLPPKPAPKPDEYGPRSGK
jgi:Domain of unknown function (DUF4124)